MEFHVTTTVSDIKEFVFLTYGKVKTSRKKDVQQRIIFSILFVCIWFLLFVDSTSKMPVTLWYIGVFACTLGFIATFIPLVGRKATEKLRVKAMTSQCQESRVFIGEEGVRTVSDDEKQDIFFGWDNITGLVISDNLYLFLSKNGIGIFFNKIYLQGRDDEMRGYIDKFLTSDKISQRKS